MVCRLAARIRVYEEVQLATMLQGPLDGAGKICRRDKIRELRRHKRTFWPKLVVEKVDMLARKSRRGREVEWHRMSGWAGII